MGSSTSLDRYTQPRPEVTANAANAVWDTPSKSKEKNVGSLTAKRIQPQTTVDNPRPARDHLDDLIKIREARAAKRQKRDLRVQKLMPSHPKGEPQSVAFATKTKKETRSRFETLTKKVEELEKDREATKVQMEAIVAEKGALETKLEAATYRIQTLTEQLEEAKRPNEPADTKRKREEDVSDSALLSGGTRSKKKKDESVTPKNHQ